jgi:hypothetical protein
MARPKRRADNGFVLFDVIYEDGARTSNRRVPSAEIDMFQGDDAARAFLEAQDRKIAEMSGARRGRIKSLVRSAASSR